MIGLPQNHKTLTPNYDKIENSGYLDNSILSRLAVDFCYFAEVIMIKKIPKLFA
ncbi:MAG: hypothetical protein ACRCXZ_01330 [Patescibacteria group bacterium]